MKISEHWKLVPLEQTDEMRTGGGQILDYEYDVLLSAVPSAPTEAMERVIALAQEAIGSVDEWPSPGATPKETFSSAVVVAKARKMIALRNALAALEKAMENGDG